MRSLQFLLAAGLALSSCGGPEKGREQRFMATGQRYLDKKDYARAVLEFKNAAQVAPHSAEVNYRLGMAYLGTEDYGAAVKYLLKATDIDAQHAGAQAQLAQLMATSKVPDTLANAGVRAKAAYAAAPDDPTVLDAMAATQWRTQPDEAEAYLRRALEQMPGHLRSATMLADIKIAAKDYAGAEEVLRKAVETNPTSVEARLALGSFYRLRNNAAEAERQFQEALKIKPGNARAMMDLALLRVLTGNKDGASEMYKKIAALPEKNYRPAYALYLLYLVDAKQGIAELERLLAADPKDGQVRNRLTVAYLEHQRPADAKRLVDAELKRNPKNVDALLQRAQLAVMQRRDRDAERDLNQVLQSDPGSAQAHLSLASVFAARGEPLRQRQELAEAVRLNPESLKARLALANQLLRANSAQGALDVLSQARESQQRRLDFVATRNWALIMKGDLAAARKGIDQGLATAKTQEFLMQDARLKATQRDFAGSRASLEAVLKQNPEHLGALEMLMESYAGARNVPAGIQKVREYLAQRPGSAAGQLFLAGWLRQANDFRGSRAAAMAAKQGVKDSLAADLILTELDMLEGRNDDARRRLAALPKEAQAKPEPRLLAALLEEQAGNYAAAVGHYRAIVAASPQSVVALNNLAYLLVDRGNSPDEGLQYAQRVKELAPNDPTVEDTIGWAFFHKGLYPSAVDHLEKAIDRGSRGSVTRYHLAMAYFKAGNPQQAQRTLQAALRLDPRVPEAKMARELISEPAGQGR